MDAKKRLLIERHAPLAIRQKTDVSACHLSVDTSDTLRTLCPGTEFYGKRVLDTLDSKVPR